MWMCNTENYNFIRDKEQATELCAYNIYVCDIVIVVFVAIAVVALEGKQLSCKCQPGIQQNKQP